MAHVPVGAAVDLHYRDLGAGLPVVLIHGGCMSNRVWESQVTALLSAGYRVITPDLRGHGHSDKPAGPYTAERFAADIEALADELELDSFALVGWSLGATIVSEFARTHPGRLDRLVLVSSSIFERIAAVARGETVDSDLPLEAMLANQRRERPAGMERFVAGMFGEDPDEWTVRWLWTIGMQTPMWVALETLEIYDDPDAEGLRDGLAALDVPVAVFHGALDRAATLEDARTIADEVVSDGTFVPFEDSGHVPFLEESERFDGELVRFLDR
jgi:non-heme chloroperoxidase